MPEAGFNFGKQVTNNPEGQTFLDENGNCSLLFSKRDEDDTNFLEHQLKPKGSNCK